MRIVLEIGDWVLAEDDEGEVRLWSNGVTGETCNYSDVPPEVEAVLQAGSGAASTPQQTATMAPSPTQEPPPQTSAKVAEGAEPAPFRRQRGLAAAAPKPGSSSAEPLASTLLPAETLTAEKPDLPQRWAPPDEAETPSAGIGGEEVPAPYQNEVQHEPGPGFQETAPLALEANSVPPDSVELEPSPAAPRPADLPDLPPREPTPAMLTKATSMRQFAGQSQEQFLTKLTHLHLAERGLTSLGSAFQHCPRLKVLNLEGNHLQELSGIRPCCEVLHLQGNDVWDLSGWTQNLPSLATLELAENRLSLLSGLQRCSHLEELNLRGQRSELPLQLHPPSLTVFSRSLRSLDISRNRMMDIGPIAVLSALQRLDASSNELAEIPAVGSVLQRLSRLRRLSLAENPLSRLRKYRDLVIVAAAPGLEELDNKTVQPNERTFLVELHQRRQRRNSSEPPEQRTNGSTPTAGSPVGSRSASVGRDCPPLPPRDRAPVPHGGIPCIHAQNRSRSSSLDPAGRHYRRKVSGPGRLPPLPRRL